MRAHHRTEAVMGVCNAGSPLAHRLRYGVFQRGGARLDRNHLGAEQAHAVHVECLAHGIFRAHKNDALHTHQGGGGCGGDPVLSGARFGDQSRFPHLFCKERLSEDVVDLVRTCMVEVFAFEINFCTAQIVRHLFCKI